MQDIKDIKSDKPGSVSVVHLIWLPYGIELFKNFITSYATYDSGCEHELVLLFNGINDREEILPYLSFIDKYNISYRTLIHFGPCHDLDAYFWAAGQLHSEYVFFLNSYVEFLIAGWLGSFMRFISNEVGIIGASGSWQSYYRSAFYNSTWKWERNKNVRMNIEKYKRLLKARFWWSRFFFDFPNPHIRTNAFLIKRGLFLSLEHKPLKNKFMAYVLESGKKSITNQVLKKGFKALIVDRRGKAYSSGQWADCNMFWQNSQENLLIADNQTRMFEAADNENKRKLTYLAWGK